MTNSWSVDMILLPSSIDKPISPDVSLSNPFSIRPLVNVSMPDQTIKAARPRWGWLILFMIVAILWVWFIASAIVKF